MSEAAAIAGNLDWPPDPSEPYVQDVVERGGHRIVVMSHPDDNVAETRSICTRCHTHTYTNQPLAITCFDCPPRGDQQ